MSSKTNSRKVRVPRALDHLVLPVGSLAQARQRLDALGFSVAADAIHPFGTENACIYFADGTYLEPLAIAQRETCEEAARKGNVFVARDQAYRFRNGDNGFSAVMLRDDDAASAHQSFVDAGISAGRPLRFSRRMRVGDDTATLKFRTAFAADLRAPDCFFAAIERDADREISRDKLQTHANGVKTIRKIVLEEPNPSDFQYFLQEVINQRDQNAHSFGLDIASANTEFCVLNHDGLQAWYGMAPLTQGRGLRLRGAVLGVGDIDELRGYFTAQDIQFRQHQGRIIVDPAPGQGLVLAFEADE